MRKVCIQYYFFFLLLFCMVNIACNESQSPYLENYLNQHQSDTLIRDIPKSIDILKSVEADLGIPSLENGFNQLEIRIWFSTDVLYTENLFILTKKSDSWSAKLYEFVTVFDEIIDSVVIGQVDIYNWLPASGWNKFSNRIFDLGILELKDYSLIHGYYESMHSQRVVVEIASPKRYRIYSHIDIEYFKDIINEAQIIYDIIQLIEKGQRW